VQLMVGKKGAFRFTPGYYVYTGSHQRALEKRLLRHLARHKKLHWHIDYLTTHPAFRLESILIYPECEQECRINQETAKFTGATFPLIGFGNGDCSAGCVAHLWFHREPILARLTEWATTNSICYGVMWNLQEINHQKILP